MDLKFADIPNGLAAIGKVPVAGWAQILAYMAFCEISQKQIPGTPAYDGDFGWKVITSDDPEIKKKKLNSEIANGRLAMMGIIGLFFQDGLTGSPWGYWAGNPSSFWKARGHSRCFVEVVQNRFPASPSRTLSTPSLGRPSRASSASRHRWVSGIPPA